MNRSSIRYIIFVNMATLLLASLAILGLLQANYAMRYFRNEKQALLSRVVNMVAGRVKEDGLEFAKDQEQLMGYIASLSGTTVFITGEEGSIVFTAGGETLPGSKVPDRVMQVLQEQGSYADQSRLGGVFGSNHYTVGVPLFDQSGQYIGGAFASADAGGLLTYLQDIMGSFVLSAGMVMLAASFLALLLTRIMVVPIYRINEAAQQFAEGKYTVRVPVEGDNELTQLAMTFNEMAASFETTEASRRNFMGNIAHELRTPMTTIKGFIDGMLDGTIPQEERGKYLKIVSEEVGRLARLTQNMLDISRLEVGENTAKPVTFDVWESLRSVFLSTEQRIADKKIEVTGLEGSAKALVSADKDFVHQVLYNLLDNAIKFAPEGGSIQVTVGVGKGSVVVAIRNSGPGIPAESLPYIFDRFYKGDKSRGINANGSGLGLHICKVLLGQMGGRIWADSEEGKWSEFSFTLPHGVNKKGSARAAENAGKPEE